MGQMLEPSYQTSNTGMSELQFIKAPLICPVFKVSFLQSNRLFTRGSTEPNRLLDQSVSLLQTHWQLGHS